MQHILSLISNNPDPDFDTGLIDRVASLLPQPGPHVWLAEGIAADLPFAAGGRDLPDLLAEIRSAIAASGLDINILPADGRRKKLLVADMDSTMIEQECLDELADLVGLKDHVAAITERTMRGELEFEPALRERVALLKGLEAGVVEGLIRDRITLMPGGRTLIATMQANGARTALVSGGFTLFTAPIAHKLGFDEQRGNVLDIEDGRFTGAVADPVLGRAAKRATLIDLRERLGLSAAETMAVGDGANDLAMLEEAGLGVAFRAKPAVAAEAAACIAHGDLTALLYLQGYRRAEFVG